MITATAGEAFEALVSGLPAALGPALTLEAYDPATGAEALAPSSAGITEPRPSTYRATRTVPAAGRYLVRWTWGPAADQYAEDELEVLAYAVPAEAAGTVLLAGVDELEAAIGARAPTVGAARTWLELLLASASEAMEREADRIFHPLQAAGDPTGLELVHVTSGYARIPDARELTAVRLGGTTLELGGPGGYRLHARRGHPAHAIVLPGRYFYAGRARWGDHAHGLELELEGRFGFAAPPADVRMGAITWAARVYHEHQARLADQTADPEGGASAYFRQVPAGILATIKRYRIAGA